MDGTRNDGERFERGAAATRGNSPRARNAAAVRLILFTLSLYIDGKPFELAFTTMIKSRRYKTANARAGKPWPASIP